MATLKKGSRGSEVKYLQELLAIKADGIFGAQTQAAVKAYQSAHNLTPDGIVGPNTWRVLNGGPDPQDIIIPCEDLKQGASPHGSMTYGPNSSYTTYAQGGCGVVSFAVCYRALGLAPSGETATQTIQRLGKYSYQHGYRIKDGGTSASLFNTNGCNRQSISGQAKIENAVRSGKLVILHIQKGFDNGYRKNASTPGGHYIVAYGIQGDRLLLRDVGSSESRRQYAILSKCANGLKGAYIITKDEK